MLIVICNKKIVINQREKEKRVHFVSASGKIGDSETERKRQNM